jgi:hypothetical protein
MEKAALWTMALRGIEWQTFGTLTFAGMVPPESVFKRRINDWLRELQVVARSFNIPCDYFYFVRPEKGETFGRLHCHILFARMEVRFRHLVIVGPLGSHKASRASRLAKECGFGYSMFRHMGEGDTGLDYLGQPGEDEYELSKARRVLQPILSPTLWRFLMRSTQGKGSSPQTEQSSGTLTSNAISYPA